MSRQEFVEISGGMFVDSDFADAFGKIGLDSIDGIFGFTGGKELIKDNMAEHRSRCRFEMGEPAVTLFLKRYDGPSAMAQIKKWLNHRSRMSTADFDRGPCEVLAEVGINTPRVIAYGSEWGKYFEKRSFIITEKIADAEALEQKLPGYFYDSGPLDNVSEKREFIKKLAEFARRFHETGMRHRDFYLAHLFMNANEEFYLIDLHRTFMPAVFKSRYLVKDIAQLHYSAPGNIFSCTDRIRFFKHYLGREKLSTADRRFIARVKAKAWRMADHDLRHGRIVPFAQ